MSDAGAILVVDDNEMNRDLLSRRLARKGHTVEVAEDGPAALRFIEHDEFDLVLLDIMMPGMDGYEVLEKIRGRHEADDLPVIMATAKSESEDIVAALKLGANDYVTKPFDFPVVLARVNTQLALRKSRRELMAAHCRMKKDLEAAAKIQQTLLPSGGPGIDGVRCAWRYRPCDELAGDTLNVIPFDQHRVGLYVLDVSGHGVPSSLLSVILSRSLSATDDGSSVLWTTDENSRQRRVASPIEVADELSRRFPYDEVNHQYFTMVYGVLDSQRRSFTYVSAGHPPILQLSSAGEAVLHSSTGPPVALIPAEVAPSVFEQVEIELAPGDRLYLYSDGVPEAKGPGDEDFGEERIIEALVPALDRDLDDSIEDLLRHVWTWGGGGCPGDDVSVLAVEISGPSG
jgi:sigma-B regulation protein RsbU (phosphoserine phosphatase)